MAEDTGDTTGSNHTPGDPHILWGTNGALATGVRRETTVFQGDRTKIIEQFKTYAQGVKIKTAFCEAESQVGKPVATASVRSHEGHISEMEVTVLSPTPTCYWSLDWVPVTKDIHTWHADKEAEKEKPDLSQILSWEQLGANGDKASYNAFLPEPDGEVMKDATLTLAKKIRMGIASYTIHAPVLTRTVILTDVAEYISKINGLDKACTAADIGHPEITLEEGASWNDAGSFNYAAALALKPKWLHTSERVSGNPDGTFTCVSQWFGADEIDVDLYDKASDSSSGSGAESSGGTNG